MPKTIDDLTTEIRDRLDRLETSLPTRLDARDLGTRSQLPFYALYCRETWMWRVVELARCAFDCFQKEDFVSAMVLTRAAMETTAALWSLRGKLEKALKLGSVNVSELGTYLARLRVGQGKGIAQPDDPKAVHVMDFIRAVEKDCEGFGHQYDHLSEFAHPNWSGLQGSTRVSITTKRLRSSAGIFGRGRDEGDRADKSKRRSAIFRG